MSDFLNEFESYISSVKEKEHMNRCNERSKDLSITNATLEGLFMEAIRGFDVLTRNFKNEIDDDLKFLKESNEEFSTKTEILKIALWRPLPLPNPYTFSTSPTTDILPHKQHPIPQKAFITIPTVEEDYILVRNIKLQQKLLKITNQNLKKKINRISCRGMIINLTEEEVG
ncbi:hypothetical protein NPIL_61241 [Nephila pilipes]|uniref:Uncharacterized protein n=1 Tax=Nephila pilipes TaxID=299642 RepID=A0A8X6TT28_NEPPI|nr:hypothetical protein NPIL_61241 [Nephila pilipes]